MFGWISLHDLREVVINAAVVCGALTAVATFLRLPTVSKPLRWLGRTLFGDPLSEAFHDALNKWSEQKGGVCDRLDAIEYQLRPNGGSSLRDRVDSVEETVDAIESAVCG